MILIPSIDLRGGRCVRLLQGDFAAETIYDHDPAELATRYRDLGATWLHVVDLDGARDGELGNRMKILELASRSGLRLQVGGGVRTEDAARALLEGGVARIVVGSAALENTAMVQRWFSQFDSDRICLALDVRLDALGVPRVHTRGWTEATAVSLWEAIDRFAPQGLQHLLCTDIARDGALAEAGDLLQARDEGKFDFMDVKGDLFDLCRGKAKGRSSADEITLFKSAGTAIEDLATAIMLYQKAR